MGIDRAASGGVSREYLYGDLPGSSRLASPALDAVGAAAVTGDYCGVGVGGEMKSHSFGGAGLVGGWYVITPATFNFRE